MDGLHLRTTLSISSSCVSSAMRLSLSDGLRTGWVEARSSSCKWQRGMYHQTLLHNAASHRLAPAVAAQKMKANASHIAPA